MFVDPVVVFAAHPIAKPKAAPVVATPKPKQSPPVAIGEMAIEAPLAMPPSTFLVVCAMALPAPPNTSTMAAAATTVPDRLRFPLALVISEAATQAPRASFHTVRYDLFMLLDILFVAMSGRA
jgi:hypothetical protein